MINLRVVLLVLALFAALTFWWLRMLGGEKALSADPKPHEPDYYMQNFTQSTMNEQGTLHHRLSADMMLHYPDDDSTELVKPVLEVYNEEPTPWHVAAEKGWVIAGEEVVLLSGAVHIWRDTPEGTRELDVVTRDLRVLRKDRYAETDKEATLTGRGVQYRGVGMRANFKEGRLELLSRVKGLHEPKKRSLELALFVAALLAVARVWALAADKDQPIEIESDYAELRKNERQTIYKGNVIVTQGSIRMWGDALTVYYDENDELKDAILEGKPAHFKQRPEGRQEDFEGEALRMEYHAQEERLHLINQAKLTQGKSTFSGPLIVYDTKNSILTGQGRTKSSTDKGKEGEKPAGGRVRMVIPPKEKKAQ